MQMNPDTKVVTLAPRCPGFPCYHPLAVCQKLKAQGKCKLDAGGGDYEHPDRWRNESR